MKRISTTKRAVLTLWWLTSYIIPRYFEELSSMSSRNQEVRQIYFTRGLSFDGHFTNPEQIMQNRNLLATNKPIIYQTERLKASREWNCINIMPSPPKKKLNDVVLKIGNLNFFVSNNYALNDRWDGIETMLKFGHTMIPLWKNISTFLSTSANIICSVLFNILLTETKNNYLYNW